MKKAKKNVAATLSVLTRTLSAGAHLSLDMASSASVDMKVFFISVLPGYICLACSCIKKGKLMPLHGRLLFRRGSAKFIALLS
jgi:hypothetical protein